MFLTGYLAVECLDNEVEMDQICGLCGIIPEAILGKRRLPNVNMTHAALGEKKTCLISRRWRWRRVLCLRRLAYERVQRGWWSVWCILCGYFLGWIEDILHWSIGLPQTTKHFLTQHLLWRREKNWILILIQIVIGYNREQYALENGIFCPSYVYFPSWHWRRHVILPAIVQRSWTSSHTTNGLLAKFYPIFWYSVHLYDEN